MTFGKVTINLTAHKLKGNQKLTVLELLTIRLLNFLNGLTKLMTETTAAKRTAVSKLKVNTFNLPSVSR